MIAVRFCVDVSPQFARDRFHLALRTFKVLLLLLLLLFLLLRYHYLMLLRNSVAFDLAPCSSFVVFL